MGGSTRENGNVVAWQLLLERADGARRRAGEEILRFHDRLDVRGHADPGRHLLGGENGGAPRCWFFPDVRAGKGGGGKVMREPFDVPTVGRIAIIQAPGGAAIAWITPVGDQ